MNKFNLLGLSVVIIGLLVGCGSSDTSITGAGDVQTGTGYYVDSAVQGVDYECGTKSGTTDEDGKFTFEVGKECSFLVAGVPLRTTKADDLVDGVKVLEGNPDVQRFLQSIDNDNNASNGIQIDPKILEVLTQALVEHNSTGKVPTNTALDSVVTRVRDDVDTFEGVVKTPEQVAEHFAQTLGDSLKELLSGKTFYDVGSYEGGKWIEKFVINADVTLLTITRDGKTETETLSINGDKLMHGNEGKYVIFTGQTSDYLIFKNYHSDGSYDGEPRFYFSEAKAKAYYDSLSGGDTPASTSIPLQNQLIDGGAWGEYKLGASAPKSCYIFGADGSLTAYYDGDRSTGFKIQYELTNGNQMRYIVDGNYVSSTDTFSNVGSHPLKVNKVWSDDSDDREWRITSNCTSIVVNN
jgi:hypothetical protein